MRNMAGLKHKNYDIYESAYGDIKKRMTSLQYNIMFFYQALDFLAFSMVGIYV